jgi:hypothetical protein
MAWNKSSKANVINAMKSAGLIVAVAHRGYEAEPVTPNRVTFHQDGTFTWYPTAAQTQESGMYHDRQCVLLAEQAGFIVEEYRYQPKGFGIRMRERTDADSNVFAEGDTVVLPAGGIGRVDQRSGNKYCVDTGKGNFVWYEGSALTATFASPATEEAPVSKAMLQPNLDIELEPGVLAMINAPGFDAEIIYTVKELVYSNAHTDGPADQVRLYDIYRDMYTVTAVENVIPLEEVTADDHPTSEPPRDTTYFVGDWVALMDRDVPINVYKVMRFERMPSGMAGGLLVTWCVPMLADGSIGGYAIPFYPNDDIVLAFPPSTLPDLPDVRKLCLFCGRKRGPEFWNGDATICKHCQYVIDLPFHSPGVERTWRDHKITVSNRTVPTPIESNLADFVDHWLIDENRPDEIAKMAAITFAEAAIARHSQQGVSSPSTATYKYAADIMTWYNNVMGNIITAMYTDTGSVLAPDYEGEYNMDQRIAEAVMSTSALIDLLVGWPVVVSLDINETTQLAFQNSGWQPVVMLAWNADTLAFETVTPESGCPVELMIPVLWDSKLNSYRAAQLPASYFLDGWRAAGRESRLYYAVRAETGSFTGVTAEGKGVRFDPARWRWVWADNDLLVRAPIALHWA